jgi:toxin YoeB
MRAIGFHPKAFENYVDWSNQDKKVFKVINRLIKELQRTPFTGLGKPEPLRGNLKGFWSRRIDKKHRLVYKVSDTEITVISCKGHYD